MTENLSLRKAISLVQTPVVIAFGDPLLDIVVLIQNEDLLQKYNLNDGNQLEVPNKVLEQLLRDVPHGVKQIINAGGSAQNTMRILQWLCSGVLESSIGIYYGSISNDTWGTLLKQVAQTTDLDIRYTIRPNSIPTGIHLSFITESTRNFVASMGAAKTYTLVDLRKQDLSLDTVKVIYIEGFFITHSLEVAKEVIKQAQEKDIIIAFNLNGIYTFKDHHKAVCEMVGLAKIVFGNAAKMIALAQALKLKFDDVMDIPFLLNSIKRIAVDVSRATSNNWLSSDNIFVMTQGGSAPAIVVWGEGQSAQVQPIVPAAPVVDTKGAGDSLIAGFLAGILANWDPKSCLEYGCKIASFIITKLGVTLPTSVPSDLLQ